MVTLAYRTMRVDGVEVGGEFIEFTTLVALGGREGVELRDEEEAILVPAGLAEFLPGTRCHRATEAGYRLINEAAEAIPCPTWQRITYSWKGTKQAVVLRDPVTAEDGSITGAEAGTDGDGRWLHTVPAKAKIHTMSMVTRAYFTDQAAPTLASALRASLQEDHPRPRRRFR